MLALALLWVAPLVAGAGADGPWRQVGDGRGVTVFQRAHDKTGAQESLAVGTIDAPPLAVKRALDDYEAKDGAMPYLVEMRILKREPRGALIYHRTAPPLIASRDYTIRMSDDEYRRPLDGVLIYMCRWRTANSEGPPPRADVVRVDVTEGYWQLEPQDGGTRTRATYYAFATPGGAIPREVAEWGTSIAIPEIFEALRARVRNPKYATP